MPVPTGCQPAGPRCQTSIFPTEPPVPTTESTWVALPTLPSNHGVAAAPGCRYQGGHQRGERSA